MNSQTHAFEVPSALEAGTPPRCHRPMVAQPVVPWTPTRLLGAVLMAMVLAPAQLVPAVINRRRA